MLLSIKWRRVVEQAYSPPSHNSTLVQHGVRHTAHHTHFTVYALDCGICGHCSETFLDDASGCSSELPGRQGYVPVLLRRIQVCPPLWRGSGKNPNGHCRQYAQDHDNVTPISKGFSDDRNGWGASIVDSLSTMVSEFLPLLPV